MKTPGLLLALAAIISFTTAGCFSPRTGVMVSDTRVECSPIANCIAVVPSSYPHGVVFDRRGVQDMAWDSVPDWTSDSARGMVGAAAYSHPIMLGLLAIPATGAVLGFTYGAASGLARSHSGADVALADEALIQTRLAKGLQTRIAEQLCKTPTKGETAFVLAPDAKRSDGADALLELEVLSLRLVNDSSWSPRLTLKASAYARLKRAADGRTMNSVVVNYAGTKHLRLRDWSVDNGQPMRDELERCSRELAAAVARKLAAGTGANGSPTPQSLATIRTTPAKP
ncbi:MAG: hypothetical protein HY300_08765 [Verrucomicrobia bacterium]|nr:hypothetical protein [Verrucomicrobiota bacterium]